MDNEPGREPAKTGLRGQVTMAIERGDCDALVAALTELNMTLTGNATADFAPNNTERLRADLAAFLEKAKNGNGDHVVYLGDGGLSRVILEVDEGHVICDFTGNSTEEVKKRWETMM